MEDAADVKSMELFCVTGVLHSGFNKPVFRIKHFMSRIRPHAIISNSTVVPKFFGRFRVTVLFMNDKCYNLEINITEYLDLLEILYIISFSFIIIFRNYQLSL